MRFIVLLVTSLSLVLSSRLPAAETIVVSNCMIGLDEELKVPAQEAGVLMKLPVREGQQVKRGDLLAQIDDVLPQAKCDIARYKLDVAKKQAADNVDVRYARAGYDVAAAAYKRLLSADKQFTGAVTATELDEKRLEAEKFRLMIEKAQKEFDVAGKQQQVSEAELRAADEDVKRRQIISPLSAVVVELTAHEGEWVQAGDTVMRLLRMDVLRVEGSINVRDHQPSEVEGRQVEIAVTLAHNNRVVVPGKIVFVNPLVQGDGQYRVRAEVPNRREGNSWLLSPGLTAEMAIQLQ